MHLVGDALHLFRGERLGMPDNGKLVARILLFREHVDNIIRITADDNQIKIQCFKLLFNVSLYVPEIL